MAIKTNPASHLKIPINAIRLQDTILEQYPDTIVIGAFARGSVTSMYLPDDDLILATHDPSLLVDIPVIIRTLFGASRKTRDVAENNSFESSIICAENISNPEADEDTSYKYGYLTEEQFMSVKKNKDYRSIILSDTDPIVPNLTKVTMKYIARPNTEINNIVVFAHLLKKDVSVDEYIAAYSDAVKDAKSMTADKIYIYKNTPYSLPSIPSALEMALSKTCDTIIPGLTEIGWKYTDSVEAKLKEVASKPGPKSIKEAYDEIARPRLAQERAYAVSTTWTTSFDVQGSGAVTLRNG